MTKTKILPKLRYTKVPGVYLKEVQKITIDSKGNIKTKITDKVYIIRYRDNGKQRFITVGKYSEGIREAYCKAKREEYITIARNGELPPQIQKRMKKNIITLDSLAQIYFDDKDDTRSKSKQEGRYNLHIKPKLGSCDIDSLMKDDFIALQKHLKKAKKAPKTTNGILALARAIINHSAPTMDNPAAGIKPIKEEKKEGTRQRFLNVDEIQQLLEAVQNDSSSPDDNNLYTFIKMALATGARLEGVLNIKKKDINIQQGTIELKDFKNGTSYTGYLSGDKHEIEVADKLAHLRPNDNLIDVPGRTIQRKLKPILDRLFNDGLDTRDFQNRVVIHTLRHTFASHLAINGTSIMQIKDLMNHGDIEMTMRYAKLSPDSGKEKVRSLYDAG